MPTKRKLSELRVAELRVELDKRNLDSKGLKGVLLQRLQKAIAAEGGNANEIEIDGGSGKLNTSRGRKSEDSFKPIVQENIAKDEPTAVEGGNEKVEFTPKSEEIEELVKDSDEVPPADKEKSNPVQELENTEVTVTTPEMDLGHEVVDAQLPEDLPGGCDTDETINDKQTDDQFSIQESDPLLKNEDDDTTATTESPRYQGINDIADTTSSDAMDAVCTEGESLSHGEKSHQELEDENQEDSDKIDDDDAEAEDTPVKEELQDPAKEEAAGQGDDESSKDGHVVVAIEEDVLDMLDYDLEIPEQNHGSSAKSALLDDKEGSKEGSANGANKALINNDDKEGDPKNQSTTTATSDESDSKSTQQKTTDETKVPADCKNLWVSGLAASTRASELKVSFSRYGKVVGAKVVTNAKSPGSKCFGFVAMATADAASKCILHLNKTEMHGRIITVERTKVDPSASKKSSADQKSGAKSKPDSSTEATAKISERNADSPQAEPKENDHASSDERGGKVESTPNHDRKREVGKEAVDEKDDRRRPPGGRMPQSDRSRERSPRRSGENRPSPRSRDTRRDALDDLNRKRARAPDSGNRKVVIDNKGGMSLRVNVSADANRFRRSVPVRRISRSPIRGSGPAADRGRFVQRRQDVLSLNEIRRQRQQEREGATRRVPPPASRLSRVTVSSVERERQLLRKEREERDYLRQERERLERERRQLERDRLEREKLEQERMRLELERKRELEKIQREKEEMRRLQEINRYEQARSKAVKRPFDYGRTSPNSHLPHAKRSYNPTHNIDSRSDSKRVDRDDRKSYGDYDRNLSGNLRGGATSYKPRGAVPKGRSNAYDVDRRTHDVVHHDTDARYSGGDGRRVEKYDRNTGSKQSEFRRSYDRQQANDDDRGSAGHQNYEYYGRKVMVRDHTRDERPQYRRDGNARNEQNTTRRQVSPDLAWKESKGGATSRSRNSDRDLREEIGKQIPNYSSDDTHSSSRAIRKSLDNDSRADIGVDGYTRNVSRSDNQKFYPSQDRKRDESFTSNRTPLVGSSTGGKPIPTQTGRTGSSHPPLLWAWQDGAASVTPGANLTRVAGGTLPTTPYGAPPPQLPNANVPVLPGNVHPGYRAAQRRY